MPLTVFDIKEELRNLTKSQDTDKLTKFKDHIQTESDELMGSFDWQFELLKIIGNIDEIIGLIKEGTEKDALRIVETIGVSLKPGVENETIPDLDD